jgi:hypothetical protein
LTNDADMAMMWCLLGKKSINNLFLFCVSRPCGTYLS